MITDMLRDKTGKKYEILYKFSEIVVKAFEKVENEDVLGQLGFCPGIYSHTILQKKTIEVLDLKKINKINKDLIYATFKEDLKSSSLKVAVEKSKN